MVEFHAVKKRVETVSGLSVGELVEKLKGFEEKYGASYDEFIKEFDEDEASYEALIDQFEWEVYWTELRERLKRLESLHIPAESLGMYSPIFSPLRMRVFSSLVKMGEASASEMAGELKKPIGSIVTALEALKRYGIVTVERKDGRKVYAPLVKEIVITA